MASVPQLDATSILSVGSLLLACGAGAMLVVRLSNPRLRGLGWLGGAFAAGGMGALLLILYGQLPQFVAVVLSDWLILLSFVLLHVSILELRRSRSLFPRFGAGLLVALAVGYWGMSYVVPNGKGRIALFGLLLSAQLCRTVWLLVRGTRKGLREPAWFCAVLLMALTAMNVTRSVVMLVLLMHSPRPGLAHALQTATFLMFVATSIGIAFGFFWMTTTELSFDLEHMASTDPLTRIYNRRVFLDWCEKELSRSRKSGTVFSVLMIDLDHFKAVNDRFGHLSGDEMLCAVVERMQDSVRGINILGRWGGEEFVALLPGAGAEDAMVVAQRVRQNVEALKFERTALVTREPLRMTVSLGVATYRGPQDEIGNIIQRADEAMYGAKAAGRNMVLVLS